MHGMADKGDNNFMRQENNLGEDSVGRLVLRIALPSMLAQFVSMLYSMVDRMYIGNIPDAGSLALAGVGVCGPIITMVGSIAALVGIGGSPLMSMCMGEQDMKRAKDIMANCFLMLILLSVAATAILYPIRKPMLLLFGASELTMPFADEYFSICILGTLVASISVGMNQFVICQGYSKKAMSAVVIGAVINIVLDPIFIFVFKMGVTGAAIATVISQFISSCIVLSFLFSRNSPIKITFGGYRLGIMRQVATIGFTPFIIIAVDNMMVIAMNTVLQRYGGVEQGSMLVTCATIAQSFMLVVTMPLGGISGGTKTILSYNYGARQIERVNEAQRKIFLLCLAYTGLMTVFAWLGGGWFVRLFTNDPVVKSNALWAIHVCTMFLLPLGLQYEIVDGFTAIGKVRFALPLSFWRKLVYFAALFILPAIYGVKAVFYAEAIADIIGPAVSIIVYLAAMKRVLRKRQMLVSLVLAALVLSGSTSALRVEAGSRYDTIEFSGDEQELEEMNHLLFAKLAYDYLDGYEGETVTQYVSENPDLYSGEIWKDSGITYEALYSSLVGDWEIYKIFNNNTSTGFYAVAFRQNDRVILAFRGSEMFTDEFALDESNDWTGTDFKFAVLNELSRQFDDADNCYAKLKSSLALDGISAEITFAGHSLGGALVTYESLVSDVYGYSFDGAAGHVADLVYYYKCLDIDNFTGINDIRFCNYTDEPGYAVADIIQHTNCESMYQIDRETNLDNLNENTLIPKLSSAGSHIIWSCIGHEENRVFFNDTVNMDENGYTYAPSGEVCLDINRNVIEIVCEEASGLICDYEEMLGSFFGVVKDGRVMLADSDGAVMYAYEGIGVSSAFNVNTVMYGGSGSDSLYGYVGDDVLIAGMAADDKVYDILDGNLGNDVYVIDGGTSNSVSIHDIGGSETSIILRNTDVKDIADISIALLGHQGVMEIGNDGLTCMPVVAQSHENVKIYTYDNRRLKYIGSLADISGHEDIPSYGYENKYVVMLEGKGILSLYDEGEKTASFTDVSQGNGAMYTDYGVIYINRNSGSESILMVLDDKYDVRVSNYDKRVDLALGVYDDENGMIACERKYNRKFNEYKILFNESSLDDGEQGDISWEDVVDAGINFISSLFGR